MTTARKVVTTIVRAGGSATALTASTQTKELVPQREEVFSAKDVSTPDGIRDALHKVQRHVAESTQAARSLPVLGGSYWPQVSLAANTAHTFQHGISGKAHVSWLIASVVPLVANALAVVPVGVIEVGQDEANGRIALAANLDCVVDVWLYPTPSPLP